MGTGYDDWLRTPADRRAWDRGYRPDVLAADRVREFFRRFLRHSAGEFAGRGFELLDWQWLEVVRPLFGWRRPDGTRRFRRAYVEIPKKNGKSTLCAGLGLYLLVADGEPAAEVYLAAADRDQAGIVYNEAARMVRSSPALTSRLDLVPSTKRIGYHGGNGILRALSKESTTKEGLNIHGLIFDELHAQKDDKLWNTLKYGGAARRQPLFISITTAGYDRKSVCWQQHCYAEGVLNGIIDDDHFLAVIYGAKPEDDWASEDTWRRANPSYGVTVKADQFAADCQEAQVNPVLENAFRRYRLNQWTEQEVRWMPMHKWDKCHALTELSDLRGRMCFAGLDLSATSDVTALALYFPDTHDLHCRFWLPKDANSRRAQSGLADLMPWVRAGHIKLTDGNVIDYNVVKHDLKQLAEQFDIREIAIDRWNSTQLATDLMDDGFSVKLFGQGFGSMSAPTKELERLVYGGLLRHGGHPVLRWMASNVTAKTDPAGNVKPDKGKSGDRIDGVVAAVMSIGSATAYLDEQSVYNKQLLRAI